MLKPKSSVQYFLIFLVSTSIIATKVYNFTFQDLSHRLQLLQFDIASTICALIVLVLLAIVYFQSQPFPVYLVNFSCYKPRDCLKCTKAAFVDGLMATGNYTQESLNFQSKVLQSSGLGDETYLAEALFRIPVNPSMSDAIKEAEELMFGAVDQLLSKTNVDTKDIGILIVNSSIFCPTPSLSAMVVNRYKLRSNIKSYNISGMGCSSGVISMDLGKSLLQAHRNSYAMVVSAECVTLNPYGGNDRSMLVPNCLFRAGASAVLLSNRRADKRRSKYELVHTIRTHTGADDKSFTSVTQKEDSEGITGISLSKDVVIVAGDALKANITALAPLVLPLSEKLHFVAILFGKKFLNMKKLKPYVPNFKLAFEHFCVHAGGKAVLDGVQKSLVLSEWHMEPSRMTLYRFGNTSSTSIWYELAYTEAKGRVKRGDRIWQIAFGSGFKCNSSVLRALRNVNPIDEKSAWMDEIHSFPVVLPTHNRHMYT